MTSEVPFSRRVRVDVLPRDGLAQTIEADAAERAALAALNHLPAIGALTASFTLRKAGRGAVRVSGQVRAEVMQTCVVSLEPFYVVVDEPVDARFTPSPDADAPRRKSAETEVDTVQFDDEDPPEPIVDGRIDLGALAAEFMALALDPYPRKPGAVFDAPEADTEPDSPFSSLADIGKRDDEKP